MISQPFMPRFEGGYRPLDDVELQRVIETCTRAWLTNPLCRTKACTLTVMELEGEYFWDQHDHEDEAFYVISGRLQVELENGVIDVLEGQNCCIHSGTLHRPKSTERAVMLIVEGHTDILKNS